MNLTHFNNEEFFVDMQRCIGCKACEMACAECETNGQETLIHVNYVQRAETIQTTVQVCMHCEIRFVQMYALQTLFLKMNSVLYTLQIQKDA